ncbi:DUF1810 domain-containing protein [Adhaeribacter aquaticus]|uniref:DUF1810 domain-containing protein n=1 Tax=Adhaeribacter aquaticus TaxID=299567 RepID=UPI000478AE6B|nr:DUF1810 domain-containing protein [Adhaeribacter aquaticus]
MANSGLTKYIEAQEKDFELALAEIKSGRKRSHWMWYIFPQFEGLGFSETSQYYSIKTLEEAKDYLNHPVLGKRLIIITTELLKLDHTDPKNIFGSPDYLKLHSSMTLFSLASDIGNNLFDMVLEKFFGGQYDNKTLQLVKLKDK